MRVGALEVFSLGVALALCGAMPTLACISDCDRNAHVVDGELEAALAIALDSANIAICEAADNDRDHHVTVEEVVLGVRKKLDGCGGGPSDMILYSSQGNELDTYDLAGGFKQTLVPEPREHFNGQTCLVPDGDGAFLGGTDTEQPRLRPGWGIYSADGSFLQKLPLPPHSGPPADPIGCAFDAEKRFFGTAIGSPGGSDGQLVVYFPPTYEESCILDDGLRTPGTIASDESGSIYVAEGLPPGKVQRYAPPFPASAAECGSTALNKSAFIEYGDLTASLGVARGPNGHWFVSQVFGLGTAGPTIREHAADGTYIRDIIPKGKGGNPAGLAVDSEGTVYYADLGLSEAIPPDAVDGKGTVRKVTFDGEGNPRFPETLGFNLDFPDSVSLLPARPRESTTLGGNIRRSFFFPLERDITRDTAANLVPKWRYLTNAIVTASPVVAMIDLPEGATKLVITPSWDAHLYALRADNGSRVWSAPLKPQPGASFPYSSSAAVARVDGRQMIFVGGGMSMYAFDAATGERLWVFDAGTGCETCGSEAEEGERERNEVESTPLIHNGVVYFGMDIDDGGSDKGGVYAVSARDGRLIWYFDQETGSTCRPLGSDEIHRFDGYHSAEQLGLPEDFFSTRPGCDFDRTGHTCGNFVSTFALDARRGLIYGASANCDTDDNPSTPEQPGPMPPYEEALYALTLDGVPAWKWRPREVDNADLAFIGVPNLFEIDFDGAHRDVVGIGNKDGTYYVLDRDGENEITGQIEPYWSRKVVPGGAIGGIIASASVGDGGVFFGTGLGEDMLHPQKPSMWALDAGDGTVRWSDPDKSPSFGSTAGVPGVVFEGEIATPFLWIFDSVTGANLKKIDTASLPGGLASAPVVTDGVMYTGAGVGARGGRPADQGFVASETDSPISAYCLEGTPDCVTTPRCNDRNPCTYDFRENGECTSEPGPDGLRCVVGVDVGACLDGVCAVM